MGITRNSEDSIFCRLNISLYLDCSKDNPDSINRFYQLSLTK